MNLRPALWFDESPGEPTALVGQQETILSHASGERAWVVATRSLRPDWRDEPHEFPGYVGAVLNGLASGALRENVMLPVALRQITVDIDQAAEDAITFSSSGLVEINGSACYANLWTYGWISVTVTVTNEIWVGVLCPHSDSGRTIRLRTISAN